MGLEIDKDLRRFWWEVDRYYPLNGNIRYSDDTMSEADFKEWERTRPIPVDLDDELEFALPPVIPVAHVLQEKRSEGFDVLRPYLVGFILGSLCQIVAFVLHHRP